MRAMKSVPRRDELPRFGLATGAWEREREPDACRERDLGPRAMTHAVAVGVEDDEVASDARSPSIFSEQWWFAPR